MKISSFFKKDRLCLGDILFSIAISMLFFLLAPEKLFLKSNIDWLLELVVFFTFAVTGFLSAYVTAQKRPVKIDAFYVRSWSALISGIVSIPICFLFRKAALDFSIVLFLFGCGPVIGNFLFTKIWKS
jgi:hypothetical protein